MTRYMRAVCLVALAFLGWTLASRYGAREPATRSPVVYKDFDGVDKLTSVTILNFYALPGTITEGESATLCYGVAKAASVALDPPVARLSPSRNRCIEVKPTENTRYTLTAAGEDGRSVSESFEIQVKMDLLTLPEIKYFVNQRRLKDGARTIHSLCFAVDNAVQVSVDPPVVPTMKGAPRGCFYASPDRTTVFTLKVAGRRGTQVARKLTVEVP